MEGEICFLVSYAQKLDAGKSYTIYTQPLTLKVSKEAPPVVEPSVSPSNGDDTTPSAIPAQPSESEPAPESSVSGDESKPGDNEKDEKSGLPVALIIAIPVVVILAIGVVIAVVIVSKKKK